ncbi:hypothetical protein E3O44_12010 [Cryobacterium algoricola]|uniref:Asp23/Gls24 family envelope stress response protein n=1 Tax=Cryobacterium algoricola TaxID=1259183 RepID=A0ABY2IBA5_9MICO|nr:hypothetical protein [Cryobacterium algoricola]TFB86325.1 hypothetical protein E3O44_12010 [Cryobacterium algoricola]
MTTLTSVARSLPVLPLTPGLPAVLPGRGRTTVSTRALSRLVSAVAADALEVSMVTVGTTITDDRGSLALTVSAPIPILSLTGVARDPLIVPRYGGTILERAEQARQHIHHRAGELTGSVVSRVCVRLTGVVIKVEDRVK